MEKSTRWFWMSDSGWEPYSDYDSHFIETSYNNYFIQSGPSFVTHTLNRYNDDKSQLYSLDFENFKQINQKTNFKRSIKRDEINIYDSGLTCWEFKFEGMWVPYDSSVQGFVEYSYQQSLIGGSSKIYSKFPGRPENYIIDFKNMNQQNQTSKKFREIRREKMKERGNSRIGTITISLLPYEKSGVSKDVHLLESSLHQLSNDIIQIVKKNSLLSQSNLIAPTLSVKRDSHGKPFQLVLRVRKEAKILSPVIISHIESFLQRQHQITLSIEDSDVGVQMLQNDRLIKLLSSIQPELFPNIRDNVILCLVHTLIWNSNSTIYGGFVRDWVIRGEPANDIDVSIPIDDNTATNIASLLNQQFRNTNIRNTEIKSKGMAKTLVFQGPWVGKQIEVDLVDPNLKKPAPGVDTDVGNLCIRPRGILDTRVSSVGKHISIAKSISHCQKKKFVYLYEYNADKEMSRKRVGKYLNRGWVCLTFIPDHEFVRFNSLKRGKSKYSYSWWTI